MQDEVSSLTPSPSKHNDGEDGDDSSKIAGLLRAPFHLSTQDMDDESAASKPLLILSRLLSALRKTVGGVARFGSNAAEREPGAGAGEQTAHSSEDIVDYFVRRNLPELYSSPSLLSRRAVTLLLDLDKSQERELLECLDEWAAVLRERPGDDPEDVSDNFIASLGTCCFAYKCNQKYATINL